VSCSFNNTAKAVCQPYEEQQLFRDCNDVSNYCVNEGLCSSVHMDEQQKWYFNYDCYDNRTITSPPCGEWQIDCMMLPPPTPQPQFTLKDIGYLIVMATLAMSIFLNGFQIYRILHLQEELQRRQSAFVDDVDDDDDDVAHPEADPEAHDHHDNDPDGDNNVVQQDDGVDGVPDERDELGKPLLQRPPTPRHSQTGTGSLNPAEAALQVSFNLMSQRASAIRIGQQIYEEDHQSTRVMQGPGSYRKMPTSLRTISNDNCSADVHETDSEASYLKSDDDDGFFVEELEEEQEIKENQESVMQQDNNDEKNEDFFLFNRRYQPLPLPMFSSLHSPLPEQNDPEKHLQG